MKTREIREKLAGMLYYIEEIVQYIEHEEIPEEITHAIGYIKKNKEEVMNMIREQNAKQ